MFITTENEIVNLMPTARWSRPEQLFGYLEEEERVALEPLLGTALYLHLCDEYERLRAEYTDITSVTIKPTKKAKADPHLPYAHVTDRLEEINSGNFTPQSEEPAKPDEEKEVSATDYLTIRLLRICQQIEFYKMVSHKAGLLNVSFNEGGGMNVVSADGYDPADDKQIERATKDAYMSAGRATDSLLLFLEADAKKDRVFTDLWKEADAYYLHRDLLFQTARELNEYLDIKSDRMAYVSLVRDIRYCQNTYLKPRIGATLLKAVVDYANGLENPEADKSTNKSSDSSTSNTDSDSSIADSDSSDETEKSFKNGTGDELLSELRTALGFFVESRRTDLPPIKDKLARRDSMGDAMQSMATACQYVREHLDDIGEAAIGSPIYEAVKAEKERKEADERNAEEARKRQCRERCEQNRKKLFTAFPATFRATDVKS